MPLNKSNFTEDNRRVIDELDESEDSYIKNRKANLLRNKYKHLNKHIGKR